MFFERAKPPPQQASLLGFQVKSLIGEANFTMTSACEAGQVIGKPKRLNGRIADQHSEAARRVGRMDVTNDPADRKPANTAKLPEGLGTWM